MLRRSQQREGSCDGLCTCRGGQVQCRCIAACASATGSGLFPGTRQRQHLQGSPNSLDAAEAVSTQYIRLDADQLAQALHSSVSRSSVGDGCGDAIQGRVDRRRYFSRSCYSR